ncbi:MAG: ABC transporter ATP-binding protein [Halanaerobiales bacterium]|nr:ABC transporter ATP-binding protein [Halanaerobiales bacterium]
MATILKTDKVCKYFDGVKAVDKVSIEVEEGIILGIIGPNGAGKTTLFNVLTGMLAETEGKVIYKNKDITKLSPQDITNIGMSRTFQNIKLFDHLSAHENVKIGFHTKTKTGFIDAIFKTKTYNNDEQKVNEKGIKLLKRVGLAEKQEILGQNLSYGDKRRLEIARALAVEPDLLLVDEPTAGMNAKETRTIVELLDKLNDEGITVIIIEHDMGVIMNLCDEIVVLNDGNVISRGDPNYVQNDPAVREAYLGKGAS